MAKKNDTSKCPECGYRIALASAYVYDLEVQPDQEPYESGTEEPVIIRGEQKETIFISFFILCHVCPACGRVEDLEMTSRE